MQRIIQVGVGGYGSRWLSTVMATGEHAAYAALVDVSEAALAAARQETGIPESRCFSSLAAALDQVDADAVLCIVPPAHHEGVIVPALESGLHVLSEKPLADTVDSMHRIVAAARRSQGRLMISQKGRYHPWVQRFRQAVTAAEIGRLNHVTLQFRNGYFEWGASRFRHRMADPLLVEMSIHHFDLLRALLGRNAVDVMGRSWNWAWSDFAGDVAACLVFTMEDDVPLIYEGNCLCAGEQTSWYGEVRAEGERGTITMRSPRLYITPRGSTRPGAALPADLMAVTTPHDGQAVALAEFLNSIEQDRPAETSVEDNQQSMAMLFAAVDACHTGTRRAIADYLA